MFIIPKNSILQGPDGRKVGQSNSDGARLFAIAHAPWMAWCTSKPPLRSEGLESAGIGRWQAGAGAHPKSEMPGWVRAGITAVARRPGRPLQVPRVPRAHETRPVYLALRGLDPVVSPLEGVAGQ